MAYYLHHRPGYKQAAASAPDLRYLASPAGPGSGHWQGGNVPPTSLDPESRLTQEYMHTFPQTNSPQFSKSVRGLPPGEMASLLNTGNFLSGQAAPARTPRLFDLAHTARYGDLQGDDEYRRSVMAAPAAPGSLSRLFDLRELFGNSQLNSQLRDARLFSPAVPAARAAGPND